MDVGATVRKAQTGDPAAREALARAWLPVAYGAALAALGRAADAEDAAQEAFLRAFRSLRTLRDPAAFGPWLLRIVRNAARDQRRRAPSRPLPEDPAAADPPPEESVVRWRALPEAERLVVWWRVAEGMPFRAIADLLGTSKSAVDRTFRRALERMRKEEARC